MNFRYRALAAAMGAAVLLPLAACGGEETAAAVTTAPATEAETTEEIDYSSLSMLERLQIDYESVPDGLPDADLGGEEIIVHAAGANPVGPEEMDGDIINDAMFMRTSEIEERFNCTVKLHSPSYADIYDYQSQMNSIFLSGDDLIDLMFVWNTTSGRFAREGYFTDMYDLPYIDFDKPWFFREASDHLSYRGHRYVTVDLLGGNTVYSSLSCVFFNKEIAENYGIENLYDVVRENRWVFDYVLQTVRDVYSDLNGDGKVSRKYDLFGFEMPVAQFSFEALPAMGAYIIGKDADDVPYLAPTTNMERCEKIYSTMRSFVKENDSVMYSDWGDGIFQGNRALMFYNAVGQMSNMREVDFNIGILPLFRFDESQEDYRSCFIPYPSAIPITCQTPERSALLLTAYAAGGYKRIAVPYFETVVKNKLSTDEDSAEMLDIIASNVTTDGTIMYTQWIYSFLDFVNSKKEFSSFFAKYEVERQAQIDETVEAFDEMLGL